MVLCHDERERHRNRKATHQRSDAALPRKLSETAQHAIPSGLSKAQGLIHILAELGTPNAYPAPGSKVITTSYA